MFDIVPNNLFDSTGSKIRAYGLESLIKALFIEKQLSEYF